MAARERATLPARGPLPRIGPRYITDVGAQNVPRYSYEGSDNSFVYQHFCSPLAEFLVRNFVPRWMAPNVITCSGLLPSLLAFSLVWCHCPDLVARCPPWCWAVGGVCTFVYQTLDNMDGKQARRTGTSSPLGLLLDHGADALNIVLNSINVMALMQAGASRVECAAIWLTGSMPFFFATWEEYYTGSLYLGFFNGPTDGVLIFSASQLLSAFVGDYTRFWASELAFGVSRRVAMMSFYSLCVVVTVSANFVAVIRACREPSRRGKSAAKNPSIASALGATLPFFIVNAAVLLWLATPAGSSAFARQPRLVFWLAGLLFLKLVTHLQLSHICGEPYQPWRRTLVVPLILMGANAMCGHPIDEVGVLGACVLLLALSWLHMTWSVVEDMASILGIHVFSIPHVSEFNEGKKS